MLGMSGLIEYRDLVQGSEEWHDVRRGMVTASTVGQLLSINPPDALDVACPTCLAIHDDPCLSLSRKQPTPMKTCHQERTRKAAALPQVVSVANNETSRNLTALLVSERLTGVTEETYFNSDMMRGVEDEPRARDLYSATYAPVTEVGFLVREWGDGYTLGYSPDGLVGEFGLIEVKSRRPKKHLQTIISGEVPAENMAQLQAGLLVSNREWIDYVSYCGGMPMWVKRVEPDRAWRNVINLALSEFEVNARQITRAYRAATKGLPTTERIAPLQEMRL